MKSLNQYIQEKLIINKDYNDGKIVVKSFDELRKIIEDRYDKLGAGTKQNPIDFNDIDVSNLDSFNDRYKGGIFEETYFKYIDLTYWDVSNAKSIRNMFYECEALKSVGDISGWNVSKVTDMYSMFCNCKELESIGDVSKWNVSNVTDMNRIFYGCKYFNKDISRWNVSKVTNMGYMFCECENFNQDISGWDVSNVTDMLYMFYNCKSFNQDISSWNVSNVRYKNHIFDSCSIKKEYKPKFK